MLSSRLCKPWRRALALLLLIALPLQALEIAGARGEGPAHVHLDKLVDLAEAPSPDEVNDPHHHGHQDGSDVHDGPGGVGGVGHHHHASDDPAAASAVPVADADHDGDKVRTGSADQRLVIDQDAARPTASAGLTADPAPWPRLSRAPAVDSRAILPLERPPR